MRILLLHDAFLPSSSARATTFLTQVVRHARDAGHDLRELISHDTDAGKGPDHLRSLLRERLDAEMASFDAQIIHAHGLGILGHLALESGAPYVVSAFAEELLLVQSTPTWPSHAQQAMENAGCVIVDGDDTRRGIERLFGELQAFALVETEPEVAGVLEWLWEIYRDVADRRRPL